MAKVKQTPRTKGDVLETAVRAIEKTILESAPGLSRGTFKIEGKTIRVVKDVRHEVDVYVTVGLPSEYESVFIFECKNWEERAGKNEIIIFSEKIKAFNAMKGFFVAKSYTRDARAQAKNDPRIALLDVKELGPLDSIQSIVRAVEVKGLKALMQVDMFGDVPEGVESLSLPGTAPLMIDDKTVEVLAFTEEWANREFQDYASLLPSFDVDDGVHLIPIERERVFDQGQAWCNGEPVERLTLKAVLSVYIKRAVIVSGFDVANRGRFVTVESRLPRLVWCLDLAEIETPQLLGQPARVPNGVTPTKSRSRRKRRKSSSS